MPRGVFERKVVLTGGSTLIVSLPKEWCKQVGIEPGDKLSMILQPDYSLRIMPKREEKRTYETTMTINGKASPKAVEREFIARYLLGYDIIRIQFEEGTYEHRAAIKNALSKKLIGVEIIEEDAKSMIVQCLAKPSELSVRDAIRRMMRITSSMVNDAVNCIAKPSSDILREIVEREDTVDKFYLFIVRQLKSAALGLYLPSEVGLKDLRESLGYRIVSKSVERVADHAKRVAMYIPKLKCDKICELLIKLGKKSSVMFDDATRSFLELNKAKAHEIVERAEELGAVEASILETLLEIRPEVPQVLAISTVLESLKRVADYSADIAEITINLAAEESR